MDKVFGSQRLDSISLSYVQIILLTVSLISLNSPFLPLTMAMLFSSFTVTAVSVTTATVLTIARVIKNGRTLKGDTTTLILHDVSFGRQF